MWKLLTCPESLVAKIIKARYHPRTSVLQASAGHNPSYMWRSILAAKDVVIQGSRLQVGCGNSIFIGKDPWLPDTNNGFVPSNLHAELAAAPVSSLLVPNQRAWDYDLVLDLFNARDKELILQIPLSSRRNDDVWYWLADSRGCYSVRSCYNVLHSLTPGPFTDVWRKLWNLNVPNKVKNFVWRAATNVLPTAVNLISKRVNIPPTCAVCLASDETILHSLVECNVAKACWISSSVGFVGHCYSFLEWLDHIFTRCSKEECHVAMMICWRVWINRNDKVWNNKTGSVNQVLNSAGQLLYQWQAAKKQQFYADTDVHKLVHGAICWERPKFGWVKRNVDAAIFSSQGNIGFGCVLRNSEGVFLTARCAGMAGNFGAREAEALGIREALSWLKGLQFPCVIVETDCLQVFQALVEEFSGPNGFGLIVDECRALAKSLGEVQFSFVRRSTNLAAHSVARAVGSMSGPQEWNFVPPLWLLHSL